jgi:hypothetical protein
MSVAELIFIMEDARNASVNMVTEISNSFDWLYSKSILVNDQLSLLSESPNDVAH